MRKPLEFETHPTPYVVAQTLGLYRCVGDAVHDGDTFTAFLDLGFFSYRFEDIRILGVDAYEVVGIERALGLQAKAFAVDWLLGKPLLIRTQMSRSGAESKSFDRFLADVYVTPTALGDGTLFAPLLIAAGLGVPA